MPGTPAILGLAAIGICLLVLLSARFGFSGSPVLDGPAEAAEIANGISGGFATANYVLGRGNSCALLMDDRERLALIVPHGAHFIVRLLGGDAQLSWSGHVLSVEDRGWTGRLTFDDDQKVNALIDKVGTGI